MFLLIIKKNFRHITLLYLLNYSILETFHAYTIVIGILLDFSGLIDYLK